MGSDDAEVVQHEAARSDRRLRWGGVALLLYAVCWLPALIAPHPPTDPAHNRAFALAANDGTWRLANFLAAASLTLLQLGLLALHAHLAGMQGRSWSLAAMWETGELGRLVGRVLRRRPHGTRHATPRSADAV